MPEEKKTEIGGVKLVVKGDLAHGDCFLVVGPNYYGYGNSIKAAREACIRAGCSRKAKMLAFYGDENIGVNDFGQISADKVLINLGEV